MSVSLINKMEQTNIHEPYFRLNFSQLAKGNFTADWTIRGDTIEEIKQRQDEIKPFVIKQLNELNENGNVSKY